MSNLCFLNLCLLIFNRIMMWFILNILFAVFYLYYHILFSSFSAFFFIGYVYPIFFLLTYIFILLYDCSKIYSIHFNLTDQKSLVIFVPFFPQLCLPSNFWHSNCTHLHRFTYIISQVINKKNIYLGAWEFFKLLTYPLK